MMKKEPIEEVMVVELNGFLQHTLPLIHNFTEYKDISTNDLLVELLIRGVRQCHPYFQIYQDDYKKIQTCNIYNKLKIK